MYRAINPPQQQTRASESLFSKAGINLRDLPQLLDSKFALNITNFIITADGGLQKRKGISELFSVAGTDPVTAMVQYTDDIILFGYDTTLAYYRFSDDSITNIKTDFVNADMELVRYGDYAFVASSGDKIGRISQTLNYDNQSANFTIGEVVTGGTSGATAIVLEDADGGATGTLTLGSINGTFDNNEAITGSVTGVADVDGTLSLTFTSITGAPIARTIRAIGNRLYGGNTLDDPTEVRYSFIDDGTNPPFTTWTVSDVASEGGRVNYRQAGVVRSIESLGDTGVGEIVVVFSDNGKWAFSVTLQDVAGVLTKTDQTIIDRQDFGGFRGALQTPKGLFYVNERGLWQMVSLGQDNVKFSDQEVLSSVLLGVNYFDDVDLTNCDLVYNQQYNTVLIAAAKQSAQNNYVIAYNVEQKAFSEFKGWSISRFMSYQDNFYAGSSTSTKVYNLLDGTNDDGKDIWCDFYTELKTGNLNTRQQLMRTWINGILSTSSSISICFDIFDKEGNFVANKLCLTWSPNDSSNIDGWGVVGWGVGPFGGDVDDDTLVESFAGRNTFIRNFQRLRVHITEHSQLPLDLRWLHLEITKLIDIKRRNLQLS